MRKLFALALLALALAGGVAVVSHRTPDTRARRLRRRRC